jgi:hypothetical protein
MSIDPCPHISDKAMTSASGEMLEHYVKHLNDCPEAISPLMWALGDSDEIAARTFVKPKWYFDSMRGDDVVTLFSVLCYMCGDCNEIHEVTLSEACLN